MHIITMLLWVKSHIHYCLQMHSFCLLLLYCCSSQGLLNKLPCDRQHIVPAFKRDDLLLYWYPPYYSQTSIFNSPYNLRAINSSLHLFYAFSCSAIIANGCSALSSSYSEFFKNWQHLF